MRFKSLVIGGGCVVVAALVLGALPTTGFALTPANLLLNPDASIGTGNDVGSTVADWTIGGDTNPGRDNGAFDGFTPPASTYSFYGGSSSTGVAGDSGSFSQVVNLISSTSGLSASDIDAGKDSFNVSFYEQSLSQGTPPNDEAEVLISFQNASNVTLSGGYNSGQISNLGGWLLVQSPSPVAIPVGARDMTYEMLLTLQYGFDVDSFIASNDVTANPPGTVVPPPAPAVPLPSAFWMSSLSLLGIGSILFVRRKMAAI